MPDGVGRVAGQHCVLVEMIEVVTQVVAAVARQLGDDRGRALALGLAAHAERDAPAAGTPFPRLLLADALVLVQRTHVVEDRDGGEVHQAGVRMPRDRGRPQLVQRLRPQRLLRGVHHAVDEGQVEISPPAAAALPAQLHAVLGRAPRQPRVQLADRPQRLRALGAHARSRERLAAPRVREEAQAEVFVRDPRLADEHPRHGCLRDAPLAACRHHVVREHAASLERVERLGEPGAHRRGHVPRRVHGEALVRDRQRLRVRRAV
mmetsp:Transcript_9957/g.41220  ORF Transcript_9957/g.41220 Transcript_9957/m.41220 type:complete len:263 (-) Transcript_9957:90-878(-)